MTFVRDIGSRPLIIFGRKHEGAKRLSRLLGNWTEAAERKQRTEFTYVTVLAAHSSAYVRFRRGTYYLAAAPHQAGEDPPVVGLGVAGQQRNVAAPEAPSITFAARTGLRATGLTRGAVHVKSVRYVHLVNRTSVERDVLLDRLSASTSKKAVARFLAHPTNNHLSQLHFRLVGDAFVGPHQDVYQTANGLRAIPPGRYLLLGEILGPDRDELAPLKYEEAAITIK